MPAETPRHWLSAPLDDALPHASDTNCRQGEVDLDGEPLAFKVIEDVQCPEGPAITELIGHEPKAGEANFVDHIWFGRSETAKGSGTSRTRRFFALIRLAAVVRYRQPALALFQYPQDLRLSKIRLSRTGRELV